MKLAKDFRASARDALKGKWGLAIGAGLVASFFGAGGGGGSFNFNLSDDAGSSLDSATLDKVTEVVEQYLPIILAVVLVALVVGMAIAIAWSILASTVNIGYCRFNLDLIDGKPGSFGTLFSYFPHFWKAFVTYFLTSLYVTLWCFLFIIPGIIAAYSYALAPYIIAEDTSITPSEALRRSKELMRGNKWRFFCLEMSFLGWTLLAVLTLGIGALWLTPYTAAAYADFYREVSGTRPVIELENDDFVEITEEAPQA